MIISLDVLGTPGILSGGENPALTKYHARNAGTNKIVFSSKDVFKFIPLENVPFII